MTRQKWEYDVRYFSDWVNKITPLNKLGKRGWELVSVDQGWAYLKRPIEEKEAGA